MEFLAFPKQVLWETGLTRQRSSSCDGGDGDGASNRALLKLERIWHRPSCSRRSWDARLVDSAVMRLKSQGHVANAKESNAETDIEQKRWSSKVLDAAGVTLS